MILCFFDIFSIDHNSTAADFRMILFSDKTLSIEEKVLLAQSAKERADIVDKYDRVSRQNFLTKGEIMVDFHAITCSAKYNHRQHSSGCEESLD